MNIRKEKSMQPDIFKNVSPLGFGIMRLPMEGNAVAKSAFKLVEEAVDLGVNYFDMGYTYQNGYAEEFIGQALVKQYKRSDFYIATKMPLWEVHSEGDLERIFQDQLTRLGVEYIDYYDRIENLETKLDGRFFRCHRSFLINLKYLKSYKNGTAYMEGGKEVPVSRLRSKEFSGVILKYMKNVSHYNWKGTKSDE